MRLQSLLLTLLLCLRHVAVRTDSNATHAVPFPLLEGMKVFFVRSTTHTDLCAANNRYGRPIWITKHMNLDIFKDALRNAYYWSYRGGSGATDDALLFTGHSYVEGSTPKEFNYTTTTEDLFNREVWSLFYSTPKAPVHDRGFQRSGTKNPESPEDNRYFLAIDTSTNNWLAVIGSAWQVCVVPAAQPPMFCYQNYYMDLLTNFCYILWHQRVFPVNWQTAVSECKEEGATLASIPDATTYSTLIRLWQPSGDGEDKIWVGTRLDFKEAIKLAESEKTPEKLMEFCYNVDGSPDIYWGQRGNHQPDGVMVGHHESCFLYEYDKSLQDYSCKGNQNTFKYGYICKYRPSIYKLPSFEN